MEVACKERGVTRVVAGRLMELDVAAGRMATELKVGACTSWRAKSRGGDDQDDSAAAQGSPAGRSYTSPKVMEKPSIA